jgi:hypothetical protein
VIKNGKTIILHFVLLDCVAEQKRSHSTATCSLTCSSLVKRVHTDEEKEIISIMVNSSRIIQPMIIPQRILLSPISCLTPSVLIPSKLGCQISVKYFYPELFRVHHHFQILKFLSRKKSCLDVVCSYFPQQVSLEAW